MGEVKQINIKNRTYYFYNDVIDRKNFDARLLKIEKSFKGIYNIGQHWTYYNYKNWWLWKY